MNIRKHTLQKYLRSIAIDQLTEDYEAKGYEVFRDYPIGEGFMADLLARKNGEGIVFEVKSPKTPASKLEKFGALNKFTNDNDYRLQLVVAGPPVEKDINFPEVETLLDHHFKNDELRKIAKIAKVTYERIDFVEISELHFRETGEIQIIGYGDMEVELDFGDEISPDVFPFKFDIVIAYNNDNKLEIKEMHQMEFNTYDYEPQLEKV